MRAALQPRPVEKPVLESSDADGSGKRRNARSTGFRAALLICAFCAIAPSARSAGDETERDSLARSPFEADAPVPDVQRKRIVSRPDEDRPEDQFEIDLFGRPLTLGGQYELRKRLDADLRLSTRSPDGDDELNSDHRLELELFYAPADWIFLYAEGKGFFRSRLYQERGGPATQWIAERGETWVYLADPFGSPLSVQVGRQRMSESSEWWWDQDLDALRLHADLERFHFEIAAAEELLPLGTERGHIDPRDDEIFRLLARAEWEPLDHHTLEIFLNYQRDHSSRVSPGDIVQRVRVDDRDATITWFGVGAHGRFRGDAASLRYQVNLAWARGDEQAIDFDDTAIQGLRIADPGSPVDRHSVRGFGLDSRVTLAARSAPGQPALTLGYAYATGDRGATRDQDSSFRQSDLIDNNGRFRGVDRFRYYGELFEPNLSNMQIATAALGFRFLEKSSLELVYHAYDQVERAPFLHDTNLRATPTGVSSFLGHEWDVIVGIEEWEHVQIELIGSVFRAGKAFGPARNELAFLGYLEFQFNF